MPKSSSGPSLNASDFEKCLGKTEDTSEITQLLTKLGITKKLKITSEGYLRINLPKNGLILSFKPEDETNKKSKLKLTGVQFYSDVEKGFTTFVGSLPKNLTFSDTENEARKKAGKPTEIMKDYRLDNWIANGQLLSVQYKKTGDGIANVLIGFPRKGKK